MSCNCRWKRQDHPAAPGTLLWPMGALSHETLGCQQWKSPTTRVAFVATGWYLCCFAICSVVFHPWIICAEGLTGRCKAKADRPEKMSMLWNFLADTSDPFEPSHSPCFTPGGGLKETSPNGLSSWWPIQTEMSDVNPFGCQMRFTNINACDLDSSSCTILFRLLFIGLFRCVSCSWVAQWPLSHFPVQSPGMLSL